MTDAPEETTVFKPNYNEFFCAFTTSIPRPVGHDSFLWGPSPKDGFIERHTGHSKQPAYATVLKHAQSIWMAIISLAYGRELRSARHATWRDTICFIGNLLTHAEVLGMSKTAVNGIGRFLLARPNLGREVSQDPEIFFHLARRLRLPHLYLDAAKHLIGRNVGLRDPDEEARGFNTDNKRYYTMEKMALLTAGMSILCDELLNLRRSVGHFSSFSEVLLHLETSESNLLPDSEGEEDKYKDVAKQLLSSEHNAVIVETGTDEPGHQHWGCFTGLRWLHESIVEHPAETMHHWAKIALPAAKEHMLDPQMLWRWLLLALRSIRKSLRKSPLYQHPNHVCTNGIRPCQKCNRSQVDAKRHFAWLDPDEILKGMPERPWPLEEDLSSAVTAPQLLERKTTSASYEWMLKIGLGEVSKHLQEKPAETPKIANNGYDCAEHNVSDMVTVSRRSRYQCEQLNLELLSEQTALLE